ncbi:MAG: hypothetical protein J6V68_04110 [Clostridia bacterium]|nr:hypothetical protein [Clostridia bacterium]
MGILTACCALLYKFLAKCVVEFSHNSYGINDSIINNLIKEQEETHQRKIIDTHIVIKKGSFAEHKHVKDILWPSNFFLLSIIPSKSHYTEVDQQCSKIFHEGDVLNIRYATFDEHRNKEKLVAIVGEQDYDESLNLS